MVIRITACCTPLLVPSIYIPSHAEYTLDERLSSDYRVSRASSLIVLAYGLSNRRNHSDELLGLFYSLFSLHEIHDTQGCTRA